MEGIQRKIENYYIAQDLFNKKYKNKYKVRIFYDTYFLDIYIDNLLENTYILLKIYCDSIEDLNVEEILEGYEEYTEIDKER